MARYKISRRKNVNIGRVVTKVAVTLIALWAGGTIVNTLGTTMLCTGSPFYTGLSLIGWTVTPTQAANLTIVQAGVANVCNGTSSTLLAGADGATVVNLSNVITATNANTGILGVIGLIALASIVMEFVQIRMA